MLVDIKLVSTVHRYYLKLFKNTRSNAIINFNNDSVITGCTIVYYNYCAKNTLDGWIFNYMSIYETG